jgi:hypothetical protein
MATDWTRTDRGCGHGSGHSPGQIAVSARPLRGRKNLVLTRSKACLAQNEVGTGLFPLLQKLLSRQIRLHNGMVKLPVMRQKTEVCLTPRSSQALAPHSLVTLVHLIGGIADGSFASARFFINAGRCG